MIVVSTGGRRAASVERALGSDFGSWEFMDYETPAGMLNATDTTWLVDFDAISRFNRGANGAARLYDPEGEVEGTYIRSKEKPLILYTGTRPPHIEEWAAAAGDAA